MKQDVILSPEVFIGICKKSPQGNNNKGHVWVKSKDGLYRDLENGYVRRLI